MHLNKVVLIGRVGERGVQVTYDEAARPTCAFMLEIEESGLGGKSFKTYLPCEIQGKYAEQSAEELEPGDEVMIEGRLAYRSVTDAKTSQKTSKLCVRSWALPRVQRIQLNT